MSTYERDRLDVNGDVVNLRDAGSVRFDRAQSLTAAQQAQARGNIGAVSTSGVIDIAHGGTGKTTAYEGLANLSVPRVRNPWKDAPVGISSYYYEFATDEEAAPYDLPYRYVFVLVNKFNDSRGIAYAIKWNNTATNSSTTAIWVNNLFRTWQGWKTIVDSNGTVPVMTGGTGATDAATARTNLGITPANIGLGNVDNTSDADKPVSTAQQAALEKVVHVDSVQSFTDQEKFNARLSIGAVSIDEVEHKRFGVSGVGQSSPTLTRLYDAVGMTATPSTDVTAGSSDFDSFAPFNRRKCVGNWTAGTNKAVFNVQAYEGDADYAEDGSMGDYVAVEVEPFYYYDQDGILAVSTYPWPGYRIHPVCVDYDGNIRVRTYLPVYALAQDANGKAVSLPGYQNQYGGYKDLRDFAKTYNNDAKAYAMIEPAAVWHYEWMLQTIEFATQDMQSVMRGAAGMRYNTNDKITAAPSANKIVVGSFGSDFVVGQTILINAAYDASVDVSNYNCITAIEKCDASGTPSSSGSYYLITYDGTDRSSGITANTTKVASRPWKTGATAGYASGVNAILGHTGCPVHLTNGKYPMRYRWSENVYGNQFMTTLDLADVLISDGGNAYHLEWYFLADPRKYMAYDNYDKSVVSDTSKGWVKLGVTTSAASYVNGYIKELGADPDYPYVRVPVLTTGGSSSTYYCDYAYLVNAAEVRAVRRGGTTFLGTHDGPCFFSANTGVLSAYWYIGATLYFLQ